MSRRHLWRDIPKKEATRGTTRSITSHRVITSKMQSSQLAQPLLSHAAATVSLANASRPGRKLSSGSIQRRGQRAAASAATHTACCWYTRSTRKLNRALPLLARHTTPCSAAAAPVGTTDGRDVAAPGSNWVASRAADLRRRSCAPSPGRVLGASRRRPVGRTPSCASAEESYSAGSATRGAGTQPHSRPGISVATGPGTSSGVGQSARVRAIRLPTPATVRDLLVVPSSSGPATPTLGSAKAPPELHLNFQPQSFGSS
ncbi:uncharacterized protein LOC144100586 [Amblyomma americanum]